MDMLYYIRLHLRRLEQERLLLALKKWEGLGGGSGG